MQIGIIQFPGSNCERETIQAVRRAGMTPIEFLWNEPIEKLRAFDGVILVGGFSYEDRGRAGIIAALHPVMKEIEALSLAGKPVLGICNGAQILVESGLVPGNGIRIALTDNKRIQDGRVLGTGYYNAWVHLKLAENCKHSVFTRHLTKDTPIKVPVAHAEGRFVLDSETEAQVLEQGLVVLQYSDALGTISSEFPINPNGSSHNIAAISNAAGNVLAIMPHPERTPNGDAIFLSMRDYIALKYELPTSRSLTESTPCDLTDPTSRGLTAGSIDLIKNHEINNQKCIHKRFGMDPAVKPRDVGSLKCQHTLIVDLIITDNHAVTVEQALKNLGMSVSIKRSVHWEIFCDSKSSLHQIEASGVLYNERKSFLKTLECVDNSSLHPTSRSLTDPKSRGLTAGSMDLIENHEQCINERISMDPAVKPRDFGSIKPRDVGTVHGQHTLKTKPKMFLVRAKEDLIGIQKKQQLINHFAIEGLQEIKHGILWQIEASDSDIERILESAILFNPVSHECYIYA